MNAEIKTNVIKRNGEEVAFDLEKIINAIKGCKQGRRQTASDE